MVMKYTSGTDDETKVRLRLQDTDIRNIYNLTILSGLFFKGKLMLKKKSCNSFCELFCHNCGSTNLILLVI